MTKRVPISAPASATVASKEAKLPWMAFGALVTYAVAYGIFFGPGVDQRPITQFAIWMAATGEDLFTRVAGLLP